MLIFSSNSCKITSGDNQIKDSVAILVSQVRMQLRQVNETQNSFEIYF